VKSLVKTWRCRPAIIETVNRVFTRLERTPELETLGVCGEWNRLWETHESALKDAGHVAFTLLPKPEGKAAEAAEARMETVCRRLLEVRPWERGLSAAVLVRGNKAGREALDGLRRSQIPCALVGEERLADNPLVLACVSLAKVAAHPGDTLAWEHLRMTPLAPGLPARPGRLAETFLRDVHEQGFEAALRPWVAKMLGFKQCDGATVERCDGISHRHTGFTQRRAEQLLAAAQAFDGGGSKDCLEFADFVLACKIAEPPGAGVVQVMTMHKSKGLGFDLVFLPDMQAGNICSAGIKELHADTDGRGGTNWVLDMPGQAFSGADSALREAVRRADRAGCFEELCLLYVAMTRAKRELQIVATEPGKTAKSVHLATVLANALALEGKRQKAEGRSGAETGVADGPLYVCGDAEWWREEIGVTVKPCGGKTVEAERETGNAKQETPSPARKRHPRRLPSHAKAEAYPAGNLFAAASAKGREHGTALHELFQEVTWTGAESTDVLVRHWRAKTPAAADIADSAERAFRRALAQPEIQNALRKPEPGTGNTKQETRLDLWREKSFELILDGEWVSGTMDRVVLRRNAAGIAESAEILDYKSDRIADGAALAAAAKKYTPQMALYRRVLARLTGLGPEKIRCRLLFTAAARAVDVG
jgi:ATP-dependent helicase/nuclease subunit A